MDSNTTTTLLDALVLPDDLVELTTDQLTQLAAEIRARLLAIGDACGGHLASNLGVVELTLVLHVLFKSPQDKLVWDTSHQAYVHKMLTGRLNQMFSIRQEGGLSGFANIFESEHDAFGAGHASTALSAGLGFAHARELLNETYSVVSIIGDSSLSGGMAFEALNNSERLKSNFICILNDNNMAISKPVGNMAKYMTKIRTSSLYDNARKLFDSVLGTLPKSGSLKRKVDKSLEHLRSLILDQKYGVIFEEFGFQYLGPIDGHDIPMVMAALKYAKTYPGPILIHAITQKGKGHHLAEQDPIKYHGVSPQKKQVSSNMPVVKPLTNSEAFGAAMIRLCEQRSDVALITPAMIGGSGLTAFSTRFPEKLFDVGIAEEHAVTFVAGMARAGVRPILAIYSTFLQRGYDQLIHDVCLQKLPVVFALDRAGFAGEDGATHHGVFDMAFMLPIPNIIVLAPRDAADTEHCLHWSVMQALPVSMRYPKGTVITRKEVPECTAPPTQAECMLVPEKDPMLTILAVGSMAWEAYDAGCALQQEGVAVAVVNVRCIKPLDDTTLRPYIAAAKHVLIVEEGAHIGGVGSYIQQQFRDLNRPALSWHCLAIPDRFYDHGSIASLRKQCGLDAAGIVGYVKREGLIE